MQAALLVLSQLISAPFIMSAELADEVDAIVPASVCTVPKDHVSRYYWFDFTATREGFLVDTIKVRFSFIEDGKTEVVPSGQLPIDSEYSAQVKAMGVLNLGNGVVEELRCLG